MADGNDIRWIQGFSNYQKAFIRLSEAAGYVKNHQTQSSNETDTIQSEIIIEGLIQRFEYTFEVAWNVMKD